MNNLVVFDKEIGEKVSVLLEQYEEGKGIDPKIKTLELLSRVSLKLQSVTLNFIHILRILNLLKL
jgi:hypothetical protein